MITSGSVTAGAPPIAELPRAAVLTLRPDGEATAGQVAEVGFRCAVVSDLEALGRLSPDVVVLSAAELEEDGLPRLQELRLRLPEATIVCLAEGGVQADALIAAGAHAVLDAEDLEAVLPAAVDAARSGYVVVRRDEEASSKDERPLSARERQVLALVTLGCSNGEIAGKLHLSESTVKSHLSSAFGKLGVRTRAEATARILADRGVAAGILALPGSYDRLTVSRSKAVR